jgi:D-lyxose ketol-isomerase
MDIIRNADGTLVVPAQQERQHETDDAVETSTVGPDGEPTPTTEAPTTRLLHPGEGGYDEALAEWDLQQNPDRAPVVSTATGRQEAMTVVHAVATSPDHQVAAAVEALDDPEASGEALRHVLVGGVHSVEDFAAEVAEAEGGDPLPAHQATKIIGEVLAELD